MADLFKILLAEKLGHCDSLYESIIGKKLGGYSWISTDYEQTPYLYRAMPNMSHYYNREIMEEVVGGSVGWNQLNSASNNRTREINGLTFTNNNDGSVSVVGTCTATDSYSLTNVISVIASHKYRICGVVSTANYSITHGNVAISPIGTDGAVISSSGEYLAINLRVTSGATLNIKVYPQLTDLTLALGSTIADYVYSLEQATAGSGVAWLKEHFPKMFGQYNPYDAGSIQSVSGLVSHDMVGFNAWDEEWEVGAYNSSNGQKVTTSDRIRSKNYIRVVPNTAYYYKAPNGLQVYGYDADKSYIGMLGTSVKDMAIITPTNVHYITFNGASNSGTTYNHDICINLSDASKNGTYEPHHRNSYPLDSTLTLRGIPKLDNGKLYYDGDVYEPDGTVTRKYGVVDLGTLDWLLNAVNEFAVNLTSAKGANYAEVTNALCGKYSLDTYNHVHGHTTDKTIAVLSTNSYVYIYDTAYSDTTAFKTAMSGVYLVYELATPTTETAQPFTKTQLCDSGGTEEFVTSGIVSVGHKSKYAEK